MKYLWLLPLLLIGCVPETLKVGACYMNEEYSLVLKVKKVFTHGAILEVVERQSTAVLDGKTPRISELYLTWHALEKKADLFYEIDCPIYDKMKGKE